MGGGQAEERTDLCHCETHDGTSATVNGMANAMAVARQVGEGSERQAGWQARQKEMSGLRVRQK